MIRRETTSGGGPGWILISQIEHARVSGALAADWGAGPFAPLAPHDELLPAIIRHDDGWSKWEQRPEIDRETGRPRDFTEMPIGESLVIWRDSIERAALFGELAGYVVAGHFVRLLRQSTPWQQHGSREAAAAHQWAADFEAQQADWLRDWCQAGGADHTPAAAEVALAKLQFFDRLSLWFCVADRREPAELPTPDGPVLRLLPQSDSQIAITPWPLNTGPIELSIAGRQVPQRRYAGAADLAAEPQTLCTIRLKLVPVP